MAKDEYPIDPRTLGTISHNNFFLSTRATFKLCQIPNGTPDYESQGGSCYWYGSDENGDFVIRKSDHWCQYFVDGERTIKKYRTRIRSCSWHLIIPPPLINVEIVLSGKCYLKEFDRIIWRTKRRYDIID